jgi:hypothetical protein
MAGEGLPVQAATRVLDVTDAGYYARRSRGPSARAVRHALVTETIRQVHLVSRGTYDYRRVHAELTLGRGLIVGHGTVELLMAGVVTGMLDETSPRVAVAGLWDFLAAALRNPAAITASGLAARAADSVSDLQPRSPWGSPCTPSSRPPTASSARRPTDLRSRHYHRDGARQPRVAAPGDDVFAAPVGHPVQP